LEPETVAAMVFLSKRKKARFCPSGNGTSEIAIGLLVRFAGYLLPCAGCFRAGRKPCVQRGLREEQAFADAKPVWAASRPVSLAKELRAHSDVRSRLRQAQIFRGNTRCLFRHDVDFL
jgi:hypothetical protein